MSTRRVLACAVRAGDHGARSDRGARARAPARFIRASRRSPTVPSAPRTSSTPTARARTSARPPTAPAPVGNTATDGCSSGTLPVGTQVQVTGANKPGGHGLQQLGHDAGQRRDGRRHLRLQRHRADQARSVRRRERRPIGSRLRRPDGHSVAAVERRRDRLHVRQLRAARRRARSSARSRASSSSSTPSGWSTDVYTVTPGIPGDSGSGFMTATGQAARHPEHGRDRAARRLQRRRRPAA